MNNPPRKNAVYSALKGIVVLHMLSAIGFICFSIFIHIRNKKLLSDDKELATNYEAMISKIRTEKDPEKLRNKALKGWQEDLQGWHTILSISSSLNEGLMFLSALPIGTLILALYGIRAYKKLESAGSVNLRS